MDLIILVEDLYTGKNRPFECSDPDELRKAFWPCIRNEYPLNDLMSAENIVVFSEKHDKMVGMKCRKGPESDLDDGF